MSDIIKLLPDSIANQIAAGEVIQRPASVVKELMENAVDAGSTEIKLVLKDAGKTLIQVIDNGVGMSETDARMCFERHATSKIRKPEDLFTINTMGFRGEAMASIASIAHVDMQTKSAERELGTHLVIKGSKVISQEPCGTPGGTNIQVKHLFYNVPARRKFLKSDPTELKHILDEFHRIALAHPEIHFSLHHNENELYHLIAANLRQRIVGILGKTTNEKLVPVSEETEWIKIDGYVGKPEHSKKSKGEQFIFVNRRFIRSNYLNHAIRGAYDELISKEAYPLYVLFLELDPAKIDINVHPTKQEIKFEDERLIYNYLKVAIRHAIGRYTLTPVIDFDEEQTFVNKMSRPENPISGQGGNWSPPQTSARERGNIEQWESIYQDLQQPVADHEKAITFESNANPDESPALADWKEKKKPYQVQAGYIISPIKSGFMIIDQQSTHERILYEQNLDLIKKGERCSQNQLFTQTLEFTPSQTLLLEEILDKINFLGFELEPFGQNSFIVRAIPVGFSNRNVKESLERLLEFYTENQEFSLSVEENISRSLAVSSSIKRGSVLDTTEMEDLIHRLFACKDPYRSPTGRKCFITVEIDDIKKRFLEE